jgi:hypothetical protein
VFCSTALVSQHRIQKSSQSTIIGSQVKLAREEEVDGSRRGNK